MTVFVRKHFSFPLTMKVIDLLNFIAGKLLIHWEFCVIILLKASLLCFRYNIMRGFHL